MRGMSGCRADQLVAGVLLQGFPGGARRGGAGRVRPDVGDDQPEHPRPDRRPESGDTQHGSAPLAGVAQPGEVLHAPVQDGADNDARESNPHDVDLSFTYLGRAHQMNTSSTRAPVLMPAALMPIVDPLPGPGTPQACGLIVFGPPGIREAAGTEAPPYPPYRFPTTEPVTPVPSFIPDIPCSLTGPAPWFRVRTCRRS